MQAEFPLFHHVEGLRPRERNTRPYTLLSFVDLDVREVDEREAPVGVVIDNGVGSESLRFFEGRWWAKDRLPEGPGANIRAETGLCGGDKAGLVQESLFAALRTTSWRMEDVVKRKTQTAAELGLRLETKNDYVHALDELAAAVARHVIAVGGELHTAVPEPILAFTADDKDEARTRVTFGRPEQKGHENRTFLFPVDRWDELQGTVEDYQALTGKEVLQAATVEYRHGRLSDFSREGHDLFHAAEATVRRSIYDMYKWPKDAIMAWVDLRDSLRPAQASLKEKAPLLDADLDAVCDALEEYKDKAPSVIPFAVMAALRWRYRAIREPEPDFPAP